MISSGFYRLLMSQEMFSTAQLFILAVNAHLK